MSQVKISFLGGGNMASAIISGLIEAGSAASTITVSEPLETTRARLQSQWPLYTLSSNVEAVSSADVVVLAVKPQVLLTVCAEIRKALPTGVLVLSIAAGISSASINHALGGNCAVIRCMPNTPAMVKQGASVLFANAHTSTAQKQIAQHILGAVGLTAWIEDENLMDAVTAVSGSGPAYFFLVIESMIAAGVALGLSAELARSLAIQTALGAAALAANSEDDVAELRRKVTSPNGTTERAIQTFEAHALRDTFKAAMEACALRSKELGRETVSGQESKS